MNTAGAVELYSDTEKTVRRALTQAGWPAATYDRAVAELLGGRQLTMPDGTTMQLRFGDPEPVPCAAAGCRATDRGVPARGRGMACGGEPVPGCVADWARTGPDGRVIQTGPYSAFAAERFTAPPAWSTPRPGARPAGKRKKVRR